MTVDRQHLFAGNWKMHGLRVDGIALAKGLVERGRAAPQAAFEMVVCPPATLVRAVAEAVAGSALAVGGQDCHPDESGAHTGDISAAMLRDAGCAFVIVGHSERRSDHGETDELVRAKAAAAHGAGLIAIVCIGEIEAERDRGQTIEVVSRQLEGSLPRGASAENTVIAYEPVWAIGTGRTPTAEEIAAVHGEIRARLARLVAGAERVRILYGGSVNPGNSAGILALDDVDGALVGGASLKVDDFWAIAQSCP
jgi:triosephosphate isomerase